MPSVSVIIPTYNRAGYLGECLESVLAQTRPACEVIVVDDGSVDDTAAVVRQFGKVVNYLRKNNGGKSSALNLAIPRAIGDLIWIFDDDDVALPEAINLRHELLCRRPELGWVFSAHYLGHGGPGGRIIKDRSCRIEIDPEAALYSRLLESCFFTLQSALIRRECLLQAGPFDEAMLRSQDYDMQVRLGRRFPFYGIVEETFIIRRHSGQRGPSAERHSSESREQIWLKYDRLIGQRIRETVELCDYLPPDAHSQDGRFSERSALLARASVMASKGLIEEMTADVVDAVKRSNDGLSEFETRKCASSIHHPYFWKAVLADPSIFWDGVRRLGSSRTGRQILRIYAAAMIRHAKSYGDPMPDRVQRISTALRLLAIGFL